jgi:hypothetical protein
VGKTYEWARPRRVNCVRKRKTGGACMWMCGAEYRRENLVHMDGWSPDTKA